MDLPRRRNIFEVIDLMIKSIPSSDTHAVEITSRLVAIRRETEESPVSEHPESWNELSRVLSFAVSRPPFPKGIEDWKLQLYCAFTGMSLEYVTKNFVRA